MNRYEQVKKHVDECLLFDKVFSAFADASNVVSRAESFSLQFPKLKELNRTNESSPRSEVVFHLLAEPGFAVFPGRNAAGKKDSMCESPLLAFADSKKRGNQQTHVASIFLAPFPKALAYYV